MTWTSILILTVLGGLLIIAKWFLLKSRNFLRIIFWPLLTVLSIIANNPSGLLLAGGADYYFSTLKIRNRPEYNSKDGIKLLLFLIAYAGLLISTFTIVQITRK
jgi:hypothetical protein